jgi:hypothetical protein
MGSSCILPCLSSLLEEERTDTKAQLMGVARKNQRGMSVQYDIS